MSNVVCLLLLPLLLILPSLHPAVAGGRGLFSRLSAPSTSLPLLTQHHKDFVKMKPRLDRKQHVFHGKQFKNCKPKGFRHSSAPSRFINYRPLVSPGCSTSTRSLPRPWQCSEESRWDKFVCDFRVHGGWDQIEEGTLVIIKLPILLERNGVQVRFHS